MFLLPLHPAFDMLPHVYNGEVLSTEAAPLLTDSFSCFVQDKEGQDPNRVGGPNNPLLEGGGLTTMIGKGKDDGSFALNKLHSRR